jgi:hypothetical protein
MVSVWLFIVAGCSGPLAEIKKVDLPKEKELRAGWRDYHTYCLGNYAMLFQLKGDKAIQMDNDWCEVTSDEMASSCARFLIDSSPVMELLGENEENFGYVIYNYPDQVWAQIINPKTIRLFYRVHPKGP